VISNLLGAAGLAVIAAAVGALAGDWWWSALAGGVFAVVLAGVAQYNALRGAGEVVADDAVADLPRVPRLRSTA
jgi:hypothetical protein